MAHGYGLAGSGSNLWTREVARALVREGHTVHLLCQESQPERLDWIAEAWSWDARGRPSRLFERGTPWPGRCVLHRPELEVLPTFVRPQVRSDYVFSILDLDAARIEEYLRRNAAAISEVAREHGVPVFHVNHVLLLPEAFRRVKEAEGLPYAVMPHGSALEYVVKKDRGMREMAGRALARADRILLLNQDVRRRLREVFPEIQDLDERARTVRAGVDTDRFRVVPRAERARAFGGLRAALEGAERGRSPEQTDELLRALDALGEDGADPTALRDALDAAAAHQRGRPDRDAEARLGRVEWGEHPVALYVGRFVGGKGVPSVVTALPDVLARHPETRLVMVGAGPLREAMEALVHAMGSGGRSLVRRVLEEGDAMDPDRYGAFEASRRHLARLEEEERLEGWFERARTVDLDRVIFTGFLDHEALSHLFPLADVAIFPSLVAEASPLVVAEAAASGCFPMGTDFAGMRRTLDAIGAGLEPHLRELMRIRPEPDRVVGDIARNVAELLDRLTGREADVAHALRAVAVEHFDWRRIGAALVRALEEVARPAGGRAAE